MTLEREKEVDQCLHELESACAGSRHNSPAERSSSGMAPNTDSRGGGRSVSLSHGDYP